MNKVIALALIIAVAYGQVEMKMNRIPHTRERIQNMIKNYNNLESATGEIAITNV